MKAAYLLLIVTLNMDDCMWHGLIQNIHTA